MLKRLSSPPSGWRYATAVIMLPPLAYALWVGTAIAYDIGWGDGDMLELLHESRRAAVLLVIRDGLQALPWLYALFIAMLTPIVIWRAPQRLYWLSGGFAVLGLLLALWLGGFSWSAMLILYAVCGALIGVISAAWLGSKARW